MKKYIFSLFLLVMANNAFAMKHTFEDESAGNNLPNRNFDAFKKDKVIVDIVVDDKIEDQKEFSFSRFPTLQISKSFKDLVIKPTYYPIKPTDDQLPKPVVIQISLSPDEVPLLEFLLNAMHNTPKGSMLKDDWKVLAKDQGSRPVELLLVVTAKMKLNPEWLKKLNKEISPDEGLSFDSKVSILEAVYSYQKNSKDIGIEIKKNPLLDVFTLDLTNKYKNVSDIGIDFSIFKKLPALALERILTNEGFGTDSENSLFNFVVAWLRTDFEGRKEAFPGLLQKIDLGECTPVYLINMVAKFREDFKDKFDPSTQKKIDDLYISALEHQYASKNGIIAYFDKKAEERNSRKLIKRATFHESSNSEFAMKVEFRKIREWKIGEKYYSQPIFSNGYAFYFFMRVETAGDQPAYLAGYLRCNSESCQNPLHYLPVEVTYEVVIDNNRTKRFPTVSVVFDHFDRSIGSRMNAPNITWQDVLDGRTDIVKEDKITVIISVKFLPIDTILPNKK